MTIFTDYIIRRKTTNIPSVTNLPGGVASHSGPVKRMTISVIPNFTLADASVGQAVADLIIGGTEYPCYAGPTDLTAGGVNTFVHEPPQPITIPQRFSIVWEVFQEDGDLDDSAYGDFTIKIIYEFADKSA